MCGLRFSGAFSYPFLWLQKGRVILKAVIYEMTFHWSKENGTFFIFKTWSPCKLALHSVLREGRQFPGTATAVCFNSYLLLGIYKDVFISRLGSCFPGSFPKCDTIRSYSPGATLLDNSEQSQKGVGRIQLNLRGKKT